LAAISASLAPLTIEVIGAGHDTRRARDQVRLVHLPGAGQLLPEYPAPTGTLSLHWLISSVAVSGLVVKSQWALARGGA
jgi:hypothetical protein